MLSGGPPEALRWVGGKWASLGASTEAGESGSVRLVQASGCSGAPGSWDDHGTPWVSRDHAAQVL